MTRDELIDEVAQRLGDNSTGFKGVLNPFFDDVMRDLAIHELLPTLQVTNPFSTVLDQEDYATTTMTALSIPPIKVLRIRVPEWGVSGKIKAADSDLHYEAFRQAMPDYRGRFRLWRLYPNISQIQFWPPVDADNVGTNIGEIHFIKSPTAIAGGVTITECPYDDLGTLKWGVLALGAPFREETLIDIDKAMLMYEKGKSEMRGRIQTQTPKRVYPREF